MSTRPPSNVVFVGNIPYGLSEEQITDIFSSAGKVKNFRLVYDKETGRPKGFGFCQYPDTDSAASAVRNLNDYEIMGRKLRVDYSTEGRVDEEDGGLGSSGATRGYNQHSNGVSHTAAPQPTAPAGSLPPLPPGTPLPPGVSFQDAVSRTLSTLPPSQLLDFLVQMKSLCTADPARATELLTQAPQLSYAVFQSLLIMGLVSPEAIHSVVDTSAPPPAQAPPATYPPPPMPGYPVVTGTPPVAAPFAPPAQPPPAAPAAPQAQDPEQLMRLVLELPQETIDSLPEGERHQIMALRAQFGR